MSIFISYRRNDSADVTGRIYDRLLYSFGRDAIFKDVDSIPFGVNFRTYLNDIIEKSKILLVVIGPRWLSTTDDQGERRLDDPADFVRIEIEAALKRKIMIVPLLVSGASMPNASQLPSSLEELAFYNGIQIRPDPDFHKDMSRLIHELGTQVKPSGREGTRIYYPGSDSPEKLTLGNILDRPPVETFTIAKGKVTDFIDFLPTPWGRLFSGIVLGGIASYLLSGTLSIGFILVCAILGLIIYPHRRTVLYIAYGILLATVIALLISYFASGGFDFYSIIFWGLVGGTALGVIVSRVQHNRKKI
jgi:hypothetical protein